MHYFRKHVAIQFGVICYSTWRRPCTLVTWHCAASAALCCCFLIPCSAWRRPRSLMFSRNVALAAYFCLLALNSVSRYFFQLAHSKIEFGLVRCFFLPYIAGRFSRGTAHSIQLRQKQTHSIVRAYKCNVKEHQQCKSTSEHTRTHSKHAIKQASTQASKQTSKRTHKQ